jgi:hypothetical protein
MIMLLDSLGDYMVLTLKNWLYKKLNHRALNKINYIISTQIVAVAHNATHLLKWSVNLILLQI